MAALAKSSGSRPEFAKTFCTIRALNWSISNWSQSKQVNQYLGGIHKQRGSQICGCLLIQTFANIFLSSSPFFIICSRLVPFEVLNDKNPTWICPSTNYESYESPCPMPIFKELSVHVSYLSFPAIRSDWSWMSCCRCSSLNSGFPLMIRFIKFDTASPLIPGITRVN